MSENTEIFQIILDNLRTVAKGGNTQAKAYAELREAVPTLFLPMPTGDEIRVVTDSTEWAAFDTEARLIFAHAFFEAPRLIKLPDSDESEMVQPEAMPCGIEVWTADKRTAKSFDPVALAYRKASQDYVRVAYRQNVTMLIPTASDAPEKDETEKLPDPTGVLALVTGALQTLSEKNPDGALALLNGLDSLVKYARPYVAERKAIPATK